MTSGPRASVQPHLDKRRSYVDFYRFLSPLIRPLSKRVASRYVANSMGPASSPCDDSKQSNNESTHARAYLELPKGRYTAGAFFSHQAFSMLVVPSCRFVLLAGSQ